MVHCTVPALLSLISCANALHSFIMYVSSNEYLGIDQNLQFLYEGESSSYVFLTSGASPILIYDEENMSISFPNDGNPQSFYINGTFVSVTTQSVESQKFSFIDNKLAVDGQTDNFYVCHNTKDPKDYSQIINELMYYTDDAPQDCSQVNLIRNYIISSFVSSQSSTTSPHSSTENAAHSSTESVAHSSTASVHSSTKPPRASTFSTTTTSSSLSPSSSLPAVSANSSTQASNALPLSSSVSVIPTQSNNIAAGENIPQLPIIGLLIALCSSLI